MGKWQHPVSPVRTTDHWGDKEPPRTSPHRGTDYIGDKQALLGAVNDGTIIDIYWSDCLGWVCAVKIDKTDWVFSYCHLNCHQHGTRCLGPSAHPDGSDCMKNLKVGESVKAGQPVGRIGDSGYCSRGDHCHLVQGKTKRSAVSGKTWDAYKYIQKQIKKQSTLPQTPPKPSPEDTGGSQEPQQPKPISEPQLDPVATLGSILGRFWTIFAGRKNK